MKFLLALLFTCLTLQSVAQTNFVKNPSFEKYDICPFRSDQLVFAKYWRGVIDSAFNGNAEYFNSCSNILSDHGQHVPNNTFFFQNPRSGQGMLGAHFFYDKTPPPPSPLPSDYRDNVQGHLYSHLETGKIYCVSFWVNYAEASGYAHNKIGAYLDNGSINFLPQPAGSEITSVIPQVYTDTVISDTLNWVKIEGTFIASGNETHISIGNFFTNTLTTALVVDHLLTSSSYSYYLIDDVSVVPIDSKANAGVDRWVELGKSTQIGPVEDSTARGMDCKWYHKGKLIDSGNVITVNASTIKYAVDTYVVVQNVCGNITRDTMLLRTVPLGIPLLGGDRGGFTISPNPSNGNFTLTSLRGTKQSEKITAKVYDLLGRLVHQESLNFINKEATLILNIPSGSYILELKDEAGNVQRERIVIQ
jgi:hypothetical protein